MYPKSQINHARTHIKHMTYKIQHIFKTCMYIIYMRIYPYQQLQDMKPISPYLSSLSHPTQPNSTASQPNQPKPSQPLPPGLSIRLSMTFTISSKFNRPELSASCSSKISSAIFRSSVISVCPVGVGFSSVWGFGGFWWAVFVSFLLCGLAGFTHEGF